MTPGRKRGYREEPRRPPGESRIERPIPAPGGLELVQAFVNTAQALSGGEELRSPRDLADWLSRHALLPAGFRLTEDDLARARAIRAGLRALLAANNGAGVDEAAVARLDRAAAGARAQVRFDRDGTSRLELVSRDFDDALGTLLGFVHAAQSQGAWQAFKLCAHPGCHQAFFDFTKNHSGRWCTRRCGDRVRSKTYRRRR